MVNVLIKNLSVNIFSVINYHFIQSIHSHKTLRGVKTECVSGKMSSSMESFKHKPSLASAKQIK